MHTSTWGAYAHLQTQLRRRARVNDQTWGLEAGLDDLLLNPQADPSAAVERGRARERHRRLLRTRYLHPDEAHDTKQDLEDRETLRLILTIPDPVDRVIALATACGHTSPEIGAVLGLSPAATRKRLDRLRARARS